MSSDLNSLLSDLRTCQICQGDMPNSPNPVFQINPNAKILVAGQAPGNLADKTKKPFNDPSGVRLREWMAISEKDFYDETKVAMIPMGFCFPGYDSKGGDLPPRKICAETWHAKLLAQLPGIKLKILIGGYAQRWHLGQRAAKTLTETVRNWQTYLDDGIIPTPHPSWRNNGWIRKNPWFQNDLIPVLRASVSALI